MRIACLNGWGGRLWGPLRDWVRSTDPDVLCLQEVVHSPSARSDWLEYRDGDQALPQRAHFFRDVAAALPGHAAWFCPAAQGALWDGDIPVVSQWGLATYLRRDLTVIAQAQGFVHKQFDPHGFGDHPRSRSAHAVTLLDPRGDRIVTVAHMHGLRDPAGKGDSPARLAQAHRFRAMIDAVALQGAPTIACGDFNVEPSSETFGVLAQAGLRDLVTERGVPGTRTSHYRRPGRFADYLLVNAAVAVRRFDVVTDPEVSDHCPLILEF